MTDLFSQHHRMPHLLAVLLATLLVLALFGQAVAAPPNVAQGTPPSGAAAPEKASTATTVTEMPTPHLGYGFNIAYLNTSEIEEYGFDWIKVFGAPGHRLPHKVLVRVDAQVMHEPAAFGAEMRRMAEYYGDFIEAYEIGNEPNLDASYGWAGPPVAADYVRLLCAAYDGIKQFDPDGVVVSAGLAPTGRVSGNWNGHKGHAGGYQDEREFLREMFAAGAGECSDAIGYHPYGFRARYDVEPDSHGGTAETNCINGFCFRGVEKSYDIMVELGYGHLPIWATEYGWIVQPPNHCMSDPTFAGRQWQLVSAEEQADNLVGSFEYADAHWPWMGPMFIFNLNFNKVNYLHDCEQMRFYAVDDTPAMQRLQQMEKRYVGEETGTVEIAPKGFRFTIDHESRGEWLELPLIFKNSTAESVQLTIGSAGDLSPQFEGVNFVLAPNSVTTITGALQTPDEIGDYYSSITLQLSNEIEASLPISVTVADLHYRVLSPLLFIDR